MMATSRERRFTASAPQAEASESEIGGFVLPLAIIYAHSRKPR
jgi:hypothetical protein